MPRPAWLIVPLFLLLLAIPAFVIVAEIEILGRIAQLPPGVPGPFVALAVLWGGCLCIHDVSRLIEGLDEAGRREAVGA